MSIEFITLVTAWPRNPDIFDSRLEVIPIGKKRIRVYENTNRIPMQELILGRFVAIRVTEREVGIFVDKSAQLDPDNLREVIKERKEKVTYGDTILELTHLFPNDWEVRTFSAAATREQELLLKSNYLARVGRTIYRRELSDLTESYHLMIKKDVQIRRLQALVAAVGNEKKKEKKHEF